MEKLRYQNMDRIVWIDVIKKTGNVYGRIAWGFTNKQQSFHGLADLVSKVDIRFETLLQNKIQDESETVYSKQWHPFENKSTNLFLLELYARDNKSWQGTLYHKQLEKRVCFRSIEEFMDLINFIL
ncbi:hypothetical protein [uncultured Robinsoniella sp.]|uniref:hypothetical protein n=1 Tax=uncultured Robinsoniella sp. TaxID=904190 RepID=UPI00374E385C